MQAAKIDIDRHFGQTRQWRRRAMPRRGASLTSLLLVITIIAVCLACIRQAMVEARPLPNPDPSYPISPEDMVIALIVLGGLLMGCFTIGLAIWSRWGWWRGPASVLLGACLGAAAAAQSTRTVDWRVIAATPFVLILGALFIARRRIAPQSPGTIFTGERVDGNAATELSPDVDLARVDSSPSASLAPATSEQ